MPTHSVAAAVLRERIFNSDARNAVSVPHNQHPPFPFEFQHVGVAPAKPKVQQPLSAGSAPQAQTYNAVADAFGDAFGAVREAVRERLIFINISHCADCDSVCQSLSSLPRCESREPYSTAIRASIHQHGHLSE